MTKLGRISPNDIRNMRIDLFVAIANCQNEPEQLELAKLLVDDLILISKSEHDLDNAAQG